jgi:hypothetical protein
MPKRENPTANIDIPAWLPPELIPLFERVMREMPAFPDRKTAAKVWTDNVHKWSYRTLEALPLKTRLLNGRACLTAREFVEYGFRCLAESAQTRGGRRPATEQYPE